MFDYKDRDKNKNDRLVIRINSEEKKELLKYCKDKNISLSQYVYNLICIDITMFKL